MTHLQLLHHLTHAQQFIENDNQPISSSLLPAPLPQPQGLQHCACNINPFGGIVNKLERMDVEWMEIFKMASICVTIEYMRV